MSANAELKGTLERLEAVLASEPSAVEHLKSLESLESLTQAIAEIGKTHGIDIDASTLHEVMARGTESRDVSDDELERVAGGGLGAWLLATLGSLGSMCILWSLAVHLGKGECGKSFDQLPF